MVSDSKVFKFSLGKSFFSSSDLIMSRAGNIWTAIEQGHIMIIPAKFGQCPASNIGADILWNNWLWGTTSSIHEISPCARYL